MSTFQEYKLNQSQNPKARQLRRYWTTGKGGTTKIRWKTSGDFTRCVKYLNDYVSNEQAKRMCANYHKTMTGVWPGDARNKSIEDEEQQLLDDETLLYVETLKQCSQEEIRVIFSDDEKSYRVESKSHPFEEALLEVQRIQNTY